MITLTERAADAVRGVLATNNEACGLRIMCAAGGCAGLQYSMGLVASAEAADQVLTCHGLTVYVDPDSCSLLKGVCIDFVDDDEGAGFVFDHPNPPGCSCAKAM
ncbi:HesB/IscA family protein [Roseospirillum parvum]|uniref:Iron-sulfur cluster assembly protein n=1 Tax=Roseospirillum parvum TaxID=83401 RepID=A0A1G8GAQ8_9PROT|nr:iron-sulfur cluster assembly accessory protein [Roseospirillum parvum]SDH91361.1 iron-sulfur cluster assembly protein [Roseospirillum parvum]